VRIKRLELKKIIMEVIEEVTSEKQRRWACAQKDKPASERPPSLSAEEAEEMCKSEVKEGSPETPDAPKRKMMSDRPIGNPRFPEAHPFSENQGE
tara:strand:+ start:86 stop:370 length:285 start_codon:yes stop_codon:yes gene_type:complete